jgi:hypothetical protein
MSELIMANGSKILIICFGGMTSRFMKMPPFEFLNFLSSMLYTCPSEVVGDKMIDMMFYIDMDQCWYHKGLKGITHNIDDTVIYLNDKIKEYNNVVFMGISAGGYAAILFGSMCNVKNVIAFIPRTNLNNPINDVYKNLKNVINNNTNYLLFGDTSDTNVDSNHHISQCDNLGNFPNVKIIKKNGIDMKLFCSGGEMKIILDNILFSS